LPADEPLTPVVNGDFEQVLEPGKPAAWYYLRLARLAEGGAGRGSRHYMEFTNQVPGARSQAVQAIGVDGRRVAELRIGIRTKAEDVVADERGGSREGAELLVNYCDGQQRLVAQQVALRWRGTFEWRHSSARVEVPRDARAAIVIVGLLGATGRLSCDEVEVRLARPRSEAFER
jgi:protein-L-isoaspartate(D-aspartate) O-methyltransferase